MLSAERFEPARGRDRERVAIRQASLAACVAPILRTSFLPPHLPRPARSRDRETAAIRQVLLAVRIVPVLRASFLPPPVQVEHSSVRDRQLTVQYAGPAQFSQQAFPTAVAQAQSDAHPPTVQFLSQKEQGDITETHFQDASQYKIESYLKYGSLRQHLFWITVAGPRRSTNHRPIGTFGRNVPMGIRFDEQQ
jgi:hypothetical protein